MLTSSRSRLPSPTNSSIVFSSYFKAIELQAQADSGCAGPKLRFEMFSSLLFLGQVIHESRWLCRTGSEEAAKIVG
jgi:hypothetical protein